MIYSLKYYIVHIINTLLQRVFNNKKAPFGFCNKCLIWIVRKPNICNVKKKYVDIRNVKKKTFLVIINVWSHVGPILFFILYSLYITGPAIKEKISFFGTFFLILLPFKNKKNYFRQLIEIWTYHVKVCR